MINKCVATVRRITNAQFDITKPPNKADKFRRLKQSLIYEKFCTNEAFLKCKDEVIEPALVNEKRSLNNIIQNILFKFESHQLEYKYQEMCLALGPLVTERGGLSKWDHLIELIRDNYYNEDNDHFKAVLNTENLCENKIQQFNILSYENQEIHDNITENKDYFKAHHDA